MSLSITRRRLSALAAASLLSAAAAAPAFAAGTVSVQLNGNTLNLNPAPTERAGRVFVPLRGVFENLGASVVYANGVINASGRGHNVSLHVGSTQATVDGQQQNLDVAPFIIGASTYVPLRFVSQALGATVNYDGSNRIVAISTNGNAAPNPPAQTVTAAPKPANNSALVLSSRIPAPNSSITAATPTIEATFGNVTADPNTVKVYLDDLDITADATRSPHGFAYAPRSPLQAGKHTVRVTGSDAAGARFDHSWSFTTGASAAAHNSIRSLSPADGDSVGNQFSVSGVTAPNSRVVVQVGVQSQQVGSIGQLIGAIIGANTSSSNSAQQTVTADGNGRFTTQISIGASSGSQLLMVVQSTDPRSGEAAQAQARLRVR